MHSTQQDYVRAIASSSYKQKQHWNKLSQLELDSIELLTVTLISCHSVKANRDKFTLINRSWKCKKCDHERLIIIAISFTKIDQHYGFGPSWRSG